MTGEVPGFSPPEAKSKTVPATEKPKYSREISLAMAGMITATLLACAKEPVEAVVVPGQTVVEKIEKKHEKPEWTSGVYDLLRSEIKNPEDQIKFEAILEDEALRHFQNKFSSPEDKKRDPRNFVFYSNKIENFFGSLKNPQVKKQIYDLFKKYCQETGVPMEIAMAVAANETGISPRLGIMQVEINTAKHMGVSPEKLKTLEGHIKAGVKTLAEYYEKFGHQWGLAIAAYNGGSGDVFNFLKDHGYLNKEQKYEYAGDDPTGFYVGGAVPNIASMYTTAYSERGKSKPAFGYVFRVIAMSQVLKTINWDKRGESLKVDTTKLWRPELWKEIKKPEKNKRKDNPALKNKIMPTLPTTRRNTKNPIWAKR